MAASRTELINDLVAHEWNFFQQVNNRGGRASCQDMPATFSVMRSSQFAIWTDEMLESYFDDLRVAFNEGRNPLSEKYGYMMESTHPAEYAEIADKLPAVSAHKAELVEAIVAIQLEWAEEMAAKYPAFMGHGRPLHTSEDGVSGGTSVETYSRGELKTYSERTLELMLAHFSAARDEGRNLQEESDTVQVKGLGYESLDAAEAKALALGR